MLMLTKNIPTMQFWSEISEILSQHYNVSLTEGASEFRNAALLNTP